MSYSLQVFLEIKYILVVSWLLSRLYIYEKQPGKVDTLIIIPNDRLLDLCAPPTGVDTVEQLS